MANQTQTIEFPSITTTFDQWIFFRKAIDSFNKKIIKFSNELWDYWIDGNGEETLIFFHSAIIDPEMFFYPAYTLKVCYQVILLSIPDHLMNFKEVIELYEALIEKEQIKKVTLIGYSYGGGLVQTLMDFVPEKIDRVVLSHTGLLWGRKKPKGIFLIKLFLKLMQISMLKKILLKKRLKNCSDSEWNEFYQQYFISRIENLKKKTLVNYINAATQYLKSYQTQEHEERIFEGDVILLGTEGYEDTFHTLDSFRKIFSIAKEHAFKDSGGHHFIFLHPRKYTTELYELLIQEG